MSDARNDIRYNLANDQDKTERITVYMTERLRAKLAVYMQDRGVRYVSDAAGELLEQALADTPTPSPRVAVERIIV